MGMNFLANDPKYNYLSWRLEIWSVASHMEMECRPDA